ncbi:MAG TPA: tetratricopeptide repeat protein [Pseudonocardiaceae bacterium]|nr:tetratricopeptide repeat protein [Pseudonocardiaceae bacterium]
MISGSAEGNIVQAASIGQIHFHRGSEYPIPAQLPLPSGIFTSRDRELAELDRWFADDERRPLVVVINGSGGVGKTSLAVRWLHDVRRHFPDGQLYANLGAFSGGDAASPEDVLEWFLIALGLPADRVPAGLAERAALYRSCTADRVIAVLLDDALSAAQVRPLLPSTQRGVVVITSRWRLAGLRADGARFLDTGPLSVADSVELLRRLLDDDRSVRERGPAEELARLCGGMPIALAVIGARLAAHPNRPLAREVGHLREGDRLASLSHGTDSPVETVFDLSYQELPRWERQVFRLGALHPGPSFGVDVLAAALGPAADVEDALDALVERNLLAEVDDRRFRFHDLLLAYARQQAEWEDPAAQRDHAVRAMAEWYLDVAVAADLALLPTRRRVGPRFDRGRPRPVVFTSHREALAWLDSERANVLAAARAADEHGWDDLTWQFCEAMWGCFVHARRYADWLALHDIGIPAAHRLGDTVAEARLRVQLGLAMVGLRRHTDADRELRTALTLAEQADDQFTVATTLSELAGLAQATGDLAGALDYLRAARALREVIGTPRAVALCRRRTGEVLAQLGRSDEAITELSAAAGVLRELGDLAQHAKALAALGTVYADLDRTADAVAVLTTAVRQAGEVGAARYRADAQTALGELAARTGRVTDARNHLTDALSYYADSGDPKADVVAARLAAITEPRPPAPDS